MTEIPAWVTADAFSTPYSPGGLVKRRRGARENGRMGGLASGIVRRQLAQGKRRTRDGGLGVGRAHPRLPRLSAVKLEQRYRALCALEGRRFHERGCETFCAVYGLLRRWYDAKGQGFEITNENLSRALQALGQPHSRRTVQYTRQRLERAQLITCAHVKRSGPRRVRGQMDTVRVHLLRRSSKHCTPPLRGTTKRDSVPQLGGGAHRKEEEGPPSPALSPPTSSADDTAAVAAEQLSTEKRGTATGPAPASERRPAQMWAAGRPSDRPSSLAAFTTDRLARAQQLALDLATAPAIPELAERRRLRRG